jgi:hypothetical protein
MRKKYVCVCLDAGWCLVSTLNIKHKITIGAYSNRITKTERKHYLGVFQKSLTMSQNRKKTDFALTTDESRTPFRIDRGNQPRNFATNVTA